MSGPLVYPPFIFKISVGESERLYDPVLLGDGAFGCWVKRFFTASAVKPAAMIARVAGTKSSFCS
jgi:hypothetical protein